MFLGGGTQDDEREGNKQVWMTSGPGIFSLICYAKLSMGPLCMIFLCVIEIHKLFQRCCVGFFGGHRKTHGPSAAFAPAFPRPSQPAQPLANRFLIDPSSCILSITEMVPICIPSSTSEPSRFAIQVLLQLIEPLSSRQRQTRGKSAHPLYGDYDMLVRQSTRVYLISSKNTS